PPRPAPLGAPDRRAPRAHEDGGGGEAAEPFWRRAWTCWLRALGDDPEAASSPVFDWLFATHRRLLNELLARDDVPRARRHWTLVQEVPARAAKVNEPLARAFLHRVARFRD